jgi:hypothetical protein
MEFTHHDETAKLVNQQHGGESEEVSSDGEGKQQGKDLRLRAKGRRKIKIEFIPEKTRRQITFSKRKSGLMKKVYELTTLTGTQALLLLASETGHVYSFATPKLQSIITGEEGKNLIQTCLSAPSLDTDPQYQQGPTTTVLSGPTRSNTNQPGSQGQSGLAESDSPPMPKSPPHAPRGKASYKSSPGKSSPGHSVAPSPPGHESVSPTQTAGNIPSPQHGPGASAGSAPQHFQPQLQSYESFTRPPRPEDLKGLPGNYMPYFGQPGMPPQFTERPSQSNVKLEHEQSNQSSPQQQRFAPQYSQEQSTPGKDEPSEQPHMQPLWNLYGGSVPPHVQQQMNMRAMAPGSHLAPHLAGPPMKQPQSLENFPGFPLMGNPAMSAEMYQHHQQMQMQHQMQMQQFQQMQMQEAQRNQRK